MAETRISNEDTYQGIMPTVFKKIDTSDVSVNPFQTNKLWTFYLGSSTSSFTPMIGIYTNILPNISASYNSSSNVNGSLKSVVYYSINHLFYKNKTQPYNSFGPTDLNKTTKNIFISASVFSIPSKRIGECIKPASFTYTGSVYLASDRYGNVYDTSFNSASIVTGVQYYEGFNEYFDTTRIPYESQNVTYIPGVTTTTGAMRPVGYSAYFAGNGYIKTNINGLYDRDHDYAISLFISGSNTGTTNQLILTKATSSVSPSYPFKLELSGSNQVIFTVTGETISKSIASTTIITSSFAHVLCQKTGSNLQLYINGVLEASGSSTLLQPQTNPFTPTARIHNEDSLVIGGYDAVTSNLQGSIDEIRIFNKALNSTQISYLSDTTEGGTMLQTNVVGNLFSKQGMVVVSSPDYRYDTVLTTPFTASYRSTMTLYELGVIARLDAGDFNQSQNHTLLKDDNSTYYSFVSGSSFAPYITTIGLYNDAGQLLAIAKLAQPIKKRNDVDLNFFIRLDLDKNILPG
jgi:hypothetical protein